MKRAHQFIATAAVIVAMIAGADHQRARMHLRRLCKRRFDFIVIAGMEDLQVQPKHAAAACI